MGIPSGCEEERCPFGGGAVTRGTALRRGRALVHFEHFELQPPRHRVHGEHRDDDGDEGAVVAISLAILQRFRDAEDRHQCPDFGIHLQICIDTL
jgi:hypothetical protein